MQENERSQLDNANSILSSFLTSLEGHLKKISRNTRRDQVRFDEFLADNGATGQVALQSKLTGPYVITDVIATWGSSATSVVLTIGSRIFNLPSAPGSFILSLTTGMQVDANTSPVSLTTNPVTSCYLEIQGYDSKRVMQ